MGLSIKRLEQLEGALSGIFIKGIHPNSPASRDGRLKVFDQLLEVNGRPVRLYSYEQLKSIFSQRGVSLKLTIHRNSSAAILHDIGYPIRNDNRLEDSPPYHSPSSSTMSTEYVEMNSDAREFGFYVGPGCGEYSVVNHIAPGSTSHEDGRLRIGDEVLRVNEHIVRNIASQRVMEIIQSFTQLRLMVRHQMDPLRTPTESHPMIEPASSPSSTPPHTISVSLIRDARGSLGIAIKGVVSEDSDANSPGDGIYVAKVAPDGPAALIGLVKEGDRIVKVGDTDLKSLNPKQALYLVKMSGSPVTLELERGRVTMSLESMYDLESNASDTHSHVKEASFNRNSVSDTSDHQVPTRDESVKSTSIHSGVSSIHGFYPSHLSEACLQFAHDPDGARYRGTLLREEKSRLVDEWQPRVGSEKIVKIAQLSKYTLEGGIGIEIEPRPVFSQKRELCGMRTVVSAIMDGPAKENGVLHKGDEILEINGVRVTDVHHDDVVKLIKATPQEVRFVIARPHCLGNLPSHYLMTESSPSTSEGDSPTPTTPELSRKKRLVKKQRDSEDGHSTFPRQGWRQQFPMHTDLDDVENLALLEEMKNKEKRAQDEVIEQMVSEKEKLQREALSRIRNEDDKDKLLASLEQVKLKCERETTLPRPSKYSRKYKQALGVPTNSYVTSGTSTTPRTVKPFNRIYSQPEIVSPISNTKSVDSILLNHIPDQYVFKPESKELDLSQDETTILKMVCVPFQREQGAGNGPALPRIPFPTNTSSATTSEDESQLSPTKLSYPEPHRLSPISQEGDQVHHSRWDLEPQEVTVTKGDSLGIGIERRLDPDTHGEYRVIIHDIVAGSAAAKDGRLKIGDELLMINTYSVRGRTKEEVALHITNLPRGPVILTVLHQQQNTLTKKDTEKLASAKPQYHQEETNPPPSSFNRKFALLSSHHFPPRRMDKAHSLSTLSDGSRLDNLGSRITHSSSNSNNSLNDPNEPYPLNLTLFPPIPRSSQQRQGLTNKVLDDFNMEQAGFESEGGHRHRRSKSLDLEQREEASSASLDDIPTRLLGHDLTFHQVAGDTGLKMTQGNKKDSNATPVPEVTPPKQNLVNSHLKPHPARPTTVTDKQPQVPRGIIREVRLSRKSNANLGISIVEKSIPGSVQSKGIFIKSISGPILLSGSLEQDDQILEVNGIDMKGFVHDQAVNLIKKASEPVILKVIHSIESGKRISLDKIALDNAELGGEMVRASFTSGKKGSGLVVETVKPNKERMGKAYFKISEVLKRSRAEECRNVFRDDVIMNVNGLNAVGMPHHQLLKLLNTPHAEVSLILCRAKSSLRSPRDTNCNDTQRSRRYLKTCLIDKVHEVEIGVEANQNSHRPIVVISSVKSRHPSFREEIHPGDELVAINKQNLAGYKAESVQLWLHDLRNDSQYEISFYSHAAQSSTSTGSGHSYEQDMAQGPPPYRHSSSQFTAMFYKEAKQEVGLVLVDGEVEGVFIEQVDPNGLAASDLRVRPGCKVIAVNDRKFLHDEANFVELVLNGVVGQFSLTLEGPYMHKIPHANMSTHGYFRYSSESSQELSASHSPQAPKNLPPPMHNHPELDTKLGTRLVQLVRGVDKGFGLTIRGGANTSHGDLPLFVGKVYPQQAAYRSGQIQERDVILAINDIPTTGMTRGEAVSMLKALTTVSFTLSDEKDPIDDIVLPEHQNNLLFNDLTSSRESMQSREAFMPNNTPLNSNQSVERKYAYHPPYPQGPPPPVHYAYIPTYPPNVYPDWNAAPTQYIPSIITSHEKLYTAPDPPPYDMLSHNLIVNPELILVSLKSPQRGFGFSISGGIDSQSGPQPILIKSMIEDGAAKLDGNLSVGDEICAVNGYPLVNATHHQAVNILKQCQENLKPDQEVQLWIRKRHK